jgi:hypothetical protein
MSLSSLSTELDENIIARLNKTALHNLSLTSKYYRALCEPHLCRELAFSHRDSYSINYLFLTVIERPELALHIRSVVIEVGEEGRSKSQLNKGNWEWMLDHTSAVRKLVGKVSARLGDDILANR